MQLGSMRRRHAALTERSVHRMSIIEEERVSSTTMKSLSIGTTAASLESVWVIYIFFSVTLDGHERYTFQ